MIQVQGLGQKVQSSKNPYKFLFTPMTNKYKNLTIQDIRDLIEEIGYCNHEANRDRSKYEQGLGRWYKLTATRSVWLTIFPDGYFGIASSTAGHDWTDNLREFFELTTEECDALYESV